MHAGVPLPGIGRVELKRVEKPPPPEKDVPAETAKPIGPHMLKPKPAAPAKADKPPAPGPPAKPKPAAAAKPPAKAPPPTTRKPAAPVAPKKPVDLDKKDGIIIYVQDNV